MAGRIDSYRDLLVWQQSMNLAVAVYSNTRSWPKEEQYGLTSQVRRCATSIPANIAEGYGRNNAGSYRQFLRIAQGSLKELETHLMIAARVGITAENAVTPLLRKSDEIGRMLRQLILKITPE